MREDFTTPEIKGVDLLLNLIFHYNYVMYMHTSHWFLVLLLASNFSNYNNITAYAT